MTTDGIQDILVNSVEATELAGTLFLLRGHGDGTFGNPELASGDAEAFTLPPGEPLVADVTGDGLPDVIAPGSGELHVLVSERNETNHPPQVIAAPLRRTVDLIALAGNYGCLTLPFTPPVRSGSARAVHRVRGAVAGQLASLRLSELVHEGGHGSDAVRGGLGTQTLMMTARDNRGGEAWARSRSSA